MVEPRTIEQLSVETPEAVSFAFDLADVGSRGVAAVLDALFLGLLLLAEGLLGWVVVTLLHLDTVLEGAFVWVLAGVLIAWFVTYWSYYLVGEVGFNGRTPGKRIVGIRVVRDDGSRVDLMGSLIRNLIRIIDFMPSVYGIGVASVLVTARHKRLGDLAASTVVVRDSGEIAVSFDGGAARELVLAREFLARRALLTPAARYQVAVAVLGALGEEAGDRDEAALTARIAQLVLPPPASPEVGA